MDWSSVTNPNVNAETNAIGGVFGDVINSIPYGIGDFIDDSYRAIARGYSAGQPVEDSFNLLADVDEENFNSFYDSYEEYVTKRESLGESDEMKSFNEIYEEEGRDAYGFFKGIVNNPTALSEIIFESLGTLVNSASAKTAGATVYSGATIGAMIGTATATPQGMIAGAATGAVASIPYAMGAASAVTTTGQLFGQMIESELDSRGLEWSRDNVRNLVEDEQFMKNARVKAYSAGAVVGVVDALTMKLGSSVGAKILSKGGAYSKLAATGATTAVETVGGGVSQASEALVSGTPLTSGDLTMGAIAGNVSTPITLGLAARNKTEYKINGQRVDKKAVEQILEVANDEDLSKINIEVKNDNELSSKLESRTKRIDIEKNIDPEIKKRMTPEEVKAAVDMELELEQLEGKLIRSSGQRVIDLTNKLSDLYDEVYNRVDEEVDAEAQPTTEAPEGAPTMEAPEGTPTVPERDPNLRPPEEPRSFLGKLFRRKNRDITLNGQVYDPRSRFRRLRRFFNQTFKSNAGVDRKNAEVLRQLNRNVSAFSDALQTEQKAFLDVLKGMKKNKDRDYDADLESINQYLNGQEVDLSFLTPEQKQVIDYSRTKIDALSKRLVDILSQNEGGTKAQQEARAQLIETIENNMGSYVRRTYQIFTDPEYLQGLTIPYEEMTPSARKRFDDAVEFVMSDSGVSMEEARAQIVQYLDNIKRNKAIAELGLGATGSMYAPFLKERKDVPPAIRRLLGESKDPLYNYINTAYKLENYIANFEYQRQLSTSLMESGVGVRSNQARPGYVRFAPDTEAWSSLSDIYVPEEFKIAFEEIGPTGLTGTAWLDQFIKITSYAKLGKTVLSPTTTMRNLYSGVFLGLNSGHLFALNPEKIGEYIGKAWGTEKLNDTALRAEREKLIQLGVLNDGAKAGEITAMMNDFSTDISRMSGTRSAAGKAMDAVQKAYSFGDDFYKVAGFYQEKKGFMAAGMSEADAEAKAAERIRNSYPTYSYVSPNVRKIRRFPFAGTFVSFPYEVARTTKNNLMFAIEDLNAGRTQMGMRRLAGMIAANGTLYGLSEATKDAIGFDDEDDERVRTLVPFYQENSEMIYVGSDDEGARFIDGTALFPTEVIHQPLRILMENPNDETVQQRAIDAFDNLLTPYVGIDLTSKTLLELSENKDSFGRPIYDEGEKMTDIPLLNGAANNPTKILDYLADKAGPGVYKNVKELMRALEVDPETFGDKYSTYREYTPEDALLGLLGFRVTTIDYEKAVANKVRGENQDLIEATNNQLNKVSYQRLMTEDEIRSIAEAYINNNTRVYGLMAGYVDTGKKLGLEDEVIVKAILFGGVSKANARLIFNEGQAPVPYISRDRQKSKLRSIDFTATEEKRDEFMNIYLQNMEIFNEIIQQHNDSIK